MLLEKPVQPLPHTSAQVHLSRNHRKLFLNLQKEKEKLKLLAQRLVVKEDKLTAEESLANAQPHHLLTEKMEAFANNLKDKEQVKKELKHYLTKKLTDLKDSVLDALCLSHLLTAAPISLRFRIPSIGPQRDPNALSGAWKSPGIHVSLWHQSRFSIRPDG